MRDRVRRLLHIATGGARGVTELSAIYRAVTEGRDPGPQYSSCGDLAHWLYFRLGVRLSWINRAEHTGWRMGANVTALWRGPWRKPAHLESPEPGDVWVIWSKPDGTDAHVIVCDGIEGDVLMSYEYGQAALSRDRWKPNSIEGCRKRTRLKAGDGGAWVWPNGKKLQRVLRLGDVLTAAQASACQSAADDPEQWLGRVCDEAARKLPGLRRGDGGPFVRHMQTLMGINVDGDFGNDTHQALTNFQVTHFLPTTGQCDTQTWAALLRREVA